MLIRSPKEDIARVLCSEEQIAARVEELAAELTARFGDRRPVMVCVLKGASFFYTDLCRRMRCALDLDFISVSSYGVSSQSTGVVRLNKDLEHDITGRDVILVEDIIDSGLTVHYLKKLFSARHPASFTSVAFLDKGVCHAPELAPDLVGFEIGNDFVVGYGLDYADQYRNLPYIGVLKPECYTD